jgi:hypothetical protein
MGGVDGGASVCADGEAVILFAGRLSPRIKVLWAGGAGKSSRHAAAVPRLQPRRPTVTRLPLAMALMADSGQPVVRMQKSGPPFEHSRWLISMATDNTPAPSSLTAGIREKTPPPLL